MDLVVEGSSAGGYTDEEAQDAIGSILVDSASVDLTYNDVVPFITAAVLPAGVDHNSLANTHNLTTDIDHDGLTNTHNLTTDIDHDSLTNTHNITTDIDHDSLTNTHNLTTDIDHDNLTNTHQGVDTGDSPTFNGIEITTEAHFNSEIDNGNSGAADTIVWTAGNKQKSTLTGDCTFSFTAPSGPTNLILKLVQGGVGSFDPVWPAAVKWAGGLEPKWSTGVGDIDIATFYYDGTSYFGMAALAFA